MEFTTEEKKLILNNTIIDSGVIYPTSYHSKSNTLKVTNINLNKQPGFYADRIYILKHNDIKVIADKDYSKIVQKYGDVLLKEL